MQRRHSPSPAPTRRRRLASSHTRTRPGISDRQSSRSTPGGPRSNKPDLNSYFTDGLDNPTSANALLSTQDFFDLSAAASPGLGLGDASNQAGNGMDARAEFGIFDTLGPASAPFDQFESLEPDSVMADAGNELGQNTWDVPFAPGNDVLGNMWVLILSLTRSYATEINFSLVRSASTILDLMRQGTFSQSWT